MTTGDLPCLIGAFAGRAAFGVRGYTLHSLFGISAKNKLSPLDRQKENSLRKRFEKTKLLIVDEISMVGHNLMAKVCLRLMQIKNSKQLFGGISVLVLGDFNQLRPVNDFWIWGSDTSEYQYLGIWDGFKIFELTEIMRQRDQEFIKLLNTLGDLGIEFLDDRQHNMLRARVVNNLESIPDGSVVLCPTNVQVNNFNDIFINSINNLVYENRAVHMALDKDKNHIKTIQAKHDELKMNNKDKLTETENLPLNLKFQIGKRYMITKNLDVTNGLTNGVTGILRRIDMHENSDNYTPLLRRVWIEFVDLDIGKDQREDSEVKYENWTPFENISATIYKANSGKYEVDRFQFPMVEAESMTIHKAQGGTFDSVVAVNHDSKGISVERRLRYVAYTRVRDINRLFILDYFDPRLVQNGRKTKKDLEELRKKIEQEAPNVMIRSMKRDKPFINYFPFMDADYVKPQLTIMFHNVNHVKSNLEKLDLVENDFGFKSADIIFLISTGLYYCNNNLETFYEKKQNYRGENHEIAKNGYGNTMTRDDCGYQGTLVIHRKGLAKDYAPDFVFIKNNAGPGRDGFGTYAKEQNLEIGLWRYFWKNNDFLNIVVIHRHPNNKPQNFIEEFSNFATNNNIATKSYCNKREGYYFYIESNIMIIGDFNVDFNKEFENPMWKYFFDEWELESAFWDQGTRWQNDHIGKQLDWVLYKSSDKNSKLDIKSYVYESLFSDHNPIFTEINKI